MPDLNILERKYNGEVYELSIFIIDTKTKEQIVVVPTNIAGFTFSYDINDYVPLANLKINDIDGAQLSKVSSGGNYIVSIIIKKKYDETYTCVHEFILNKMEMMYAESQTYLYNLDLISTLWYSLNNFTPYSSNGEKSSYNILREFFIKNNLPLTTNDNFIQNDTENKFSHITPCDSSVINTIDYVIKRSYNTENFGHLISYDFLSRTYSIKNVQKLFKVALNGIKNKLFPIDNILYIDNKAMGPEAKAAITRIEEQEFSGKTKTIESYKNINIKSFNHKKREWKNNKISTDTIDNALPKTSAPVALKEVNVIDKNIMPLLYKNDINYTRNVVNRSLYDTYHALHSLFYGYKSVNLQVLGSIKRNAGDILYIMPTDENTTDIKHLKYMGMYLIVKIDHIYTQEKYLNNIYAVKIESFYGI